MSNLDKDIEIVEKFIEETQEAYSETLVDGKVYRIENIPLEFKPTKELANSISNVLSEVKEYQNHKKYHCEQLEKVLSEIESYKNRENKELEKYKRLAEANLKDEEDFKQNMCEHRCLVKTNMEEELETWKKIAEKLAGYGFNCYYGSPLKFDSPEELIEIARKETEDEELARKEVEK